MKPFAVHRGTNDEDGRFLRFPRRVSRKPLRYRVDLWVKTAQGDRLKNEITTKGQILLTDLLEHQIKPSIDELIAEANDHGGVAEHGFEIYQWG